jgi:hypothetical protein
MKIVQASRPIEYWVIQTVHVDSNGMLLRPGINGSMYKKTGTREQTSNYFIVESISDFFSKDRKDG